MINEENTYIYSRCNYLEHKEVATNVRELVPSKEKRDKLRKKRKKKRK